MAITIDSGSINVTPVPSDPAQRLKLADKHGMILCGEGKKEPMSTRFDALFELKNIGGQESINWIAKGIYMIYIPDSAGFFSPLVDQLII